MILKKESKHYQQEQLEQDFMLDTEHQFSFEDDFNTDDFFSFPHQDFDKIQKPSSRKFTNIFHRYLCDNLDIWYLNERQVNRCLTELQQEVGGTSGDDLETDFTNTFQNPVVSDRHNGASKRFGSTCCHLLAGGVAGAVSRSCTAPLDRLKLTFMVSGVKRKDLSIVTTVRQLLKEGGLCSFWRGNGINIMKIAPESALKFTAYDQIKQLMKSGPRGHELGVSERFAAGSMAGAISQSIIYPLEVLKTRLVLRKTGQCRGLVDCAQQIFVKDGLRGFYRGFVPNILGIIPYAGIELTVYETLKRLYVSKQSMDVSPGMLVVLGCSVTASVCGQLASYPLALVRTRLQVHGFTPAELTGSQCSMTGMLRTVVHNDGLIGLYRGMLPNFLKVVPAVSLSFVVYEQMRSVLDVEMS